MSILLKLCEMWHNNPDESPVIQKFIDYTFRHNGNIPRNCSCIDISETLFSKFSAELLTCE